MTIGARLRVFLKKEEERTLKEMRQAENLGKRERNRATAICLSHHGWDVEKIAAYLGIGVEAGLCCMKEECKRFCTVKEKKWETNTESKTGQSMTQD